MRIKISVTFSFLLIMFFGINHLHAQFDQRKNLFDDDWKFSRSDSSAYSQKDFDDSKWRLLDLPHDWSIEHKPDSTNATKGDGGFYPAGTAWYRKTFTAPASWNNKNILIYFEGVYSNAEVFLNGEKLGYQPYGYTSFDFNLTSYIKPGQENTIVVRVDNSKQPNSRWYTGSGIYRHVWLKVTEPVHIAHWGVDINTPKIGESQSSVRIQTLVNNYSNAEKNIEVELSILKDGKNLKSDFQKIKIEKKDSTSAVKEITISNAKLWSPEFPELYQAMIKLKHENRIVDSLIVPFGFRSIEFTPEEGFKLNGKVVQINGGNAHHDNGSLGAKAYDRAEERKVDLLKSAGFNAVRTSHNIPSEAFLDACDRLGLLVIDEAFDGWREMKTTFSDMTYDYSSLFDEWWKKDVQAMVKRDRNHPSIIMWSIGNEIIERKKPEAVITARKLSEAVKEIDDTRPVTSAMTTWDADWEIFDPLMDEHDIAGYNYQMHRAEDDHERDPDRIILQTESYPKDAYYNWKMVQDHDYIIGDFVWTAIDYLGESGIGRWYYTGDPEGEHWMGNLYPWHGAYCGDIDLIGYRKPISHYRNMLWNGDEKLFMAVKEPAPKEGELILTMWAVWPTWESWTWPGYEGDTLEVEVYSKYPKVRLYLNDKVVAEKATGIEEEFKAIFNVPYQPGELKAVGVSEGYELMNTYLKTATTAERISLSADRIKIKANNRDLSYVMVEILSENNVLHPNADNLVHFELEGPGEIVAVDNANLKDSSIYTGNERKAWKGKALVIVKSTHEPGIITLRATSEGLQSSEITLKSE